MSYKLRTTCRICECPALVDFIDLGQTGLADQFPLLPDQLLEQYPLTVKVCPKCFLVQLVAIVRDDILFGEDYAFFTGASPSSVRYFKNYALDIFDRYKKKCESGWVVEIASNDGILLKNLMDLGTPNVLGVDPAGPPVYEAHENDVPTVQAFFTKQFANKIRKIYGKADIIIANNVLAHVDEVVDFMQGVHDLLNKDGVFIFECHYFPNLLFSDQFDNIYHEHRSYFSLLPLIELCKRAGLYLFDVEVADTQGGSIRCFVSRRKQAQSPTLAHMLANEYVIGLNQIETYFGFEARIAYVKQMTLDTLHRLKAEGKKIYGYGASAKGNTMLTYLGIDTNLVDKIVDKTPYKIGKFTPVTNIPIVKQYADDQPDYYLLLVWNYLAGVLDREKTFRKRGGKFIVPTLLPFII